ncbi:hypothetical protein O2K51_12000 [Apibacter raozihei]|uniref:hypothetical protein n=1 Tax=Apibacter raozihei TaxID=2500547 RepID=UPI000FE36C43|nr:hypothetical protein [Apibacter raozihei]
MKNVIKFLILFFIFIGCFLLYLVQKREYYQISDKYVTVWKTSGGCYLIPGKYRSWFIPKDNYIKTSNMNAITIIIDKNSNYDYIISNDYNKELKIIMSDYKIRYYGYKQRDEFVKEYYKDNKLKLGLKCEPIDISEL